MNKKFCWSGTIVVLICLSLMLYYYLIFRHTIQALVQHPHTVVDVKSNK